MHLLSIILLSVSANLDNFTIGMAYGIKGVKIRLWDNLIIAIVSCIGTFLSMSAGKALTGFISPEAGNKIGSCILILMGLWVIASSFQKKGNKEEKEKNRAEVSCQEIQTEKVEDEEKEKNQEKISWKEAVTLAVALTINNIGLGIAASITGLSPYLTSVYTFFISFLLIWLGQAIGRAYLAKLFGKYAVFVSGGIILMLGMYDIFL